MQKKIIFFFFISIGKYLIGEQLHQATIQLENEKKPNILNVTIHNEPPIITNTNTNMNTNYLYSLQKQVQSMIDSRHEWQKNAEEKIQALSSFLVQYAKENMFFLACLGAASGYMAIWARLIWLHHTVNQPDTWASWNSKNTIDELHALPYELISKELIISIQKKYQSTDKIADFISPLIAFIEDINKEIHSLHSFIWLHEILKQCRIIKLFPGYQKSVNQAREKLKRVNLLKNIFASWMAEYKINLSTLNPAAVGLKKALQKDHALTRLINRGVSLATTARNGTKSYS